MRYLVLTFLCSIAVIAYVQRLGVQTAYDPIQCQFGINTEQFGALSTFFLVGYASMQVPAGWLADRFGGRDTLFISAILWSSIAAFIHVCHTFEMLLGAWLVMGMALAAIFPCAAKIIGAWFPDTQKAMASGLLGSFTMLGTAVASLLTARLLVEWSWSWGDIYILYGVAGMAWAAAFFAFVPERVGANRVAAPMRPADWRRLYTSVPLWVLCGQQFFRAGAMIFFINWFPKYLHESRGFSAVDAGDKAAYVNTAALIGGVLGGFFSDWLLRRTGWRRLSRQGIAVVGLALAGALVFVAAFVEDPGVAILVFCVAAFSATFGGVSGYTVAIEYGGTRIGVVFSLMNMCGNFGAAIVNQAITSLKERVGTWEAAVFAVVVVLLVDAICWALLNPKGPLFPATEEIGHEPG